MINYVRKVWVKITREPYFALATIFLILSFSINILATVPAGTFKNFQSDAEGLVLNSYECQQRLGAGAYTGLLLQNTNDNCKKAGPYFSQSGLPFWALGNFYPKKHQLQVVYIQGIKLIWATLSALMLAVLIGKLGNKLRQGYKVLVIALLSLSPWLVLFSHSIFWLMPLFLAPILFGFMFYERFRNKPGWFYAILGLLCALKFLAGYEFTSTLAIAAVCPILWYELNLKSNWSIIIKRLSLGLAAVFTGFVLAFGVNVAQASHQVGSTSLALKTIFAQVKARSFGAVPDVDIGHAIIDELKVLKPVDFEFMDKTFHITRFTGTSIIDKAVQNLVVLYQYMASPAVTWPIDWRFPFSVFASSIGTFIIFVSVLSISAFRKRGTSFAYEDPLLAITLFALIGSLSWFVLGYKFSVIHTHITSIIFYLPFLPLSYIVLADRLQRWIKINTHNRSK